MCNKHHWALACESALAYCQASIFGQIMAEAGNINVYDIRKPCIGALCYDFSLLSEYLAQDNVRILTPVPARPVGSHVRSVCMRGRPARRVGS